MSRRKHRRRAPPDPEPWLRRLPPELHDNPKSIAWAKSCDETDRTWEMFRRELMDFYALHKACPRTACRRARRCVHREMTCYNAVEPLLRTAVFPRLSAAIHTLSAEAAMKPESPL